MRAILCDWKETCHFVLSLIIFLFFSVSCFSETGLSQDVLSRIFLAGEKFYLP